MKRILTLLAIPAIALCADPALPEKAAAPEPPKDQSLLTLDVRFTAVPRELAMELRKGFQSNEPQKAEKELERLVAEGKAEVLAAPVLQTTSGNRVVSEDIDEERYAIEFDAAVHVGGEKVVDNDDKPGLELGGTPTTFETRNIGYVVEVEPVWAADLKKIQMQYVVSHTTLAGKRRSTVEKQPGDVKVSVEQPLFHTNRVNSQQHIEPGVPALLAVFRVPGDEKRFEFVTITVHRREVK